MYFTLTPDILYDQKPISYPFSTSDKIIAKNFFRRYQLNEDVFSVAVYFSKYAIVDTETPSMVADKAYGSPFYDWVILLTNNLVNAQYDWPMSNYDLDKVLEKASIRFNPVLPTDSVERYLKLRANASKYQVGKPFFGPGILMNSIKAGVAVDYPIFMTDFSSTTVSSQLPTDYPLSTWVRSTRPASNLTFTGSVVNQSAGHLGSGDSLI